MPLPFASFIIMPYLRPILSYTGSYLLNVQTPVITKNAA